MRVVIALVIALGSGCGGAGPGRQGVVEPAASPAPFEVQPAEWALLRALVVGSDARLQEAADPLTVAVLLRDHVYQRVPRRNTRPSFPFHRPIDSYVQSLYGPDAGHICGGLALLYQTLLTAFGIPSRSVALVTSTREPFSSHAGVEVFVEGRWIISDPTFNVTFRDASGAALGYQELAAALAAGEHYETTSDGMALIEAYPTVASYPVPLRELMRYVVINAARVPDGATQPYPAVILPEDWDGTLRYADGSERSLRPLSGGFEHLLNQGYYIRTP